MKKIQITENDANQRIDKYIKKLLVNAPTNFIYKMFRKKDIKVNGKKVNEKYILKNNDVVEMFLYEDKFKEFTATKNIYNVKKTFKVLYEDNHVLIVYKPAGLLVHEDKNESVNTLTNQVLSYLADKNELDLSRENTFMPGPVHRLDRNTSGIVIFGKTLAALQVLNEMIKQRHCIEKSYLTICKGKVNQKRNLKGYIVKLDDQAQVKLVSKDYPGALTMETIVKPVKYNNDYSKVEVTLVTGRMHQIRVHLSSIDHPIIGDRKYGDFELNKFIKKEFGLNHQLLHAYKIRFVKTFGVLAYLQDKEIVCPVPKQFEKIENSLI
ncbi:MAG: RluA family pseudouridine synthase [[Clostridium] spiroforme]|uniref:Pseudouridine synthase n=1 Tax=Thomasclavelia spiroformis TaxID=29348 RepID=A0A943EJX6_9FIRM|nr:MULTISPECIES: RluA family pseudouridine synthase [Thomasclavelia]MBS5589168.1 RluA family pseudouridine synthase [Thomasclavelia spiroformis]